jgi:hypothetical protein
VLDNTYDTILDNTQRYFAVRNLIESIQQQGVAELFRRCESGIRHNQINFEARLGSSLNILLERLICLM